MSVSVPEVPGVLTASEVLATAQSIAEVQRDDGMIPWFPGGHCDPWNHVEAAMALTVCGLHAEAERAYQWLAEHPAGRRQLVQLLPGQGVKDPRLDTNVCAYLATGLYHHHLVTGEHDLLRRLWPVMEKALDFVLRWQRPDGSVRWSLDPAGRPEGYALLTGSSSIYHTLRCGVAVAERLGKDRPDWELAAGRLGHAVAHHPGAFAPKHEFAMDWYYPMLSGALEGEAGLARIDELLGHLRDGRAGRPLRVDRRLGDRGRDGRVRAWPSTRWAWTTWPAGSSPTPRGCACPTAPTGPAWSTPRR